VLVTATVLEHDTDLLLTRLDLDGQRIVMPALEHLVPGQSIRLRIRARDAALALRRPQAISIRNVLEGTIASITAPSDSPFAETLVRIGRQRVRVRLTRAALQELALAPDQAVYVLLKSVTFDRRVL
jgi:molybdate transport system ATP-binding protein